MTLILIGLLLIIIGYSVALNISRSETIDELQAENNRLKERLLDQDQVETNLRIHIQERHEYINYCRKIINDQIKEVHELKHLLEIARGNINPQMHIMGPYDFPIDQPDI